MREQVLSLMTKYLSGPFRQSGGANILTKCPFHKGGQERKPSFSVNTESGLWQCFTCHESGNLRELLKKLSLPRSTIDSELAVVRPFLERQQHIYKVEQANYFNNRDIFQADYILPETILGAYELCPNTLVQDGFDPELLRKMEIGYDRENNRVMYPLRDMYGNLAGFSGGITPWSKQSFPKYKVYQGGRRSVHGQWLQGDFGAWFDERFPDYRCENHDFLWNFDSVYPRMLGTSDRDATVYIVEGFKACLWMIQSGFENTVALMGSYISDRQQKMLHRLGCNITLFLDNDNAGRRATFNVGDLLWRPMYGRVKVVQYPQEDIEEDTQPDSYEHPTVNQLVNQSIPFTDYVNQLRKLRTTT